jgi:hypothetical protein
VLAEQLPVFFAMPGVTDDAKAPGGARVGFDAKEAIASKVLRRRLTRVGIAFAGVTIMPEARIARGGAVGAVSALKAALAQQRKIAAEREKVLRAVKQDLIASKRALAAAHEEQMAHAVAGQLLAGQQAAARRRTLFYLGRAGTGAQMHSHTPALNLLAFGRKKWFLAVS